MDKQEEKPVEETPIQTMDYSMIDYAGKTLFEWQQELSVTMPSMPCSSVEIDKTCAILNNKYQIAYNLYNNLFISYKDLESKTRRVMIAKTEELCETYTTNKVRIPGRERLEDIARNKYKAIQRHEDKLVQISILKTYFENHKNKLKDLMLLTNSLSYSINQSDRMYDKSSRTNGM